MNGDFHYVICWRFYCHFDVRADRQEVRSKTRAVPGRSLLVPISFFLTWWISLAIPSASGCAAAVGSILIPTLIAAGVHPAMAGAVVLAGTWGSAISPGNAHNPFVADLAGTDMMTVIINETPASVWASLACVIVLMAYAIWQKEGASDERQQEHAERAAADGSVIGLIVCASVFTTGMSAVGLTGALTDIMKGSQSAAAAAGTFGPFFIAVISGSGDAAAFAFNGAVTPFAAQFGLSVMDLGSLAQIAGAMGRSMSPVAGAAIICAGLAKVNPMELTKRNALPCMAAAVVLMLLL